MPDSNTPEKNQNIALFIDADNVPAAKIEEIISTLAQYGTINIRRIYGNWKSSRLQKWEDKLLEKAIQPVQQFDLTKRKNATDMRMTIDVMDILYTENVDTFCIASSDCDFTPLAMRIKQDGKIVYGFGTQGTPEPFVNACSRFLYLDEREENPAPQEPDDEKKPVPSKRKTGRELKQDTKLITLIRNAINTAGDDDGWAPLSHIGSIIANQASINARNYGYATLSALVETIDLFETRENKKNNNIEIRDKRNNNTPDQKGQEKK